jgi:hypothetical protein
MTQVQEREREKDRMRKKELFFSLKESWQGK